jgi:hypothetical protein
MQNLQQPLSSPVEFQSSKKDENTKHESKAVTVASSKRSRKDLKDNPILFTINWIYIVLSIAAAIVFGIWAPLSYEATASGNRDSNAVQGSMISALSAANDVASKALSAARAQGAALDEVQSRLGAMGQLALVGFCITETVCKLPSKFRFFASRPYISRESVLVHSSEKAILIAMSRIILGATCLHLIPQRRRFLGPGRIPRNHHFRIHSLHSRQQYG